MPPAAACLESGGCHSCHSLCLFSAPPASILPVLHGWTLPTHPGAEWPLPKLPFQPPLPFHQPQSSLDNPNMLRTLQAPLFPLPCLTHCLRGVGHHPHLPASGVLPLLGTPGRGAGRPEAPSPQQPSYPSSPCIPTCPRGDDTCLCCYLWPLPEAPGGRDPVPVPGSPWPKAPGPCRVPTRGLFLGHPHGGAKSGHGPELPANTRLCQALTALGAVTAGGGHLPTPFPSLAPAPCIPALSPGQQPFPVLFQWGSAPCYFIPAAKRRARKHFVPLAPMDSSFPAPCSSLHGETEAWRQGWCCCRGDQPVLGGGMGPRWWPAWRHPGRMKQGRAS